MESSFFPDIDKLFAVLNASQDILIVTHFHPDGDAIGSSTALLHFLRKNMHKNADIVFSSTVPETLKFMTQEEFIDVESNPEEAFSAVSSASLIICLDCNGFSRTEALCNSLRERDAFKILIDHHLKPESSEFNLVFNQTEISSTCELLFNILLQLPNVNGRAELLPESSRKSLMTGMTTDTNNFANSVFPGTFQMASSLLATGVDRDEVLEHIYRCHKEKRLRLLGHLLGEGMKITEYGVAYMLIDSKLIDRFEISEGDTEGFVNEPLAIRDVRLSILIKEYPGSYRLSVRSKRGVSANALCRDYFHGGGHEQAAGGKLSWPQDINRREDIIDHIEMVTARFMQNQCPSIYE